MATPAYCFTSLKLSMDEKPEEIIIRCNGRITADSADMFQRELCGRSIPVSRGKGVPVINRIVLDLSNVTLIDDAGLEALMDVWTAAQRKACRLEIINFGPQAFRPRPPPQAQSGIQKNAEHCLHEVVRMARAILLV